VADTSDEADRGPAWYAVYEAEDTVMGRVVAVKHNLPGSRQAQHLTVQRQNISAIHRLRRAPHTQSDEISMHQVRHGGVRLARTLV
jgi:hypothetical protein